MKSLRHAEVKEVAQLAQEDTVTPPRGVAKNPSLRSTLCCFSTEQTEQVSVIILGKLMGMWTIGHRVKSTHQPPLALYPSIVSRMQSLLHPECL